ncbi:PRC-barrel domain-containing protein [Aurantimonas sp. MSK8Z-1]|uniref:PRC-barrel domain-containing protein n=1 Tax=Mangrovibrevibacter kandeliae TaxID=2968473 RepID=UPI0021174679|nr:PRC-barrel domain-containing protein [Aurantimonas sp. MSK8Z-1]MCW4115274.1 PRC-barrel domain-containing protein [Aurantimonas sp. MSK8Z-1]
MNNRSLCFAALLATTTATAPAALAQTSTSDAAATPAAATATKTNASAQSGRTAAGTAGNDRAQMRQAMRQQIRQASRQIQNDRLDQAEATINSVVSSLAGSGLPEGDRRTMIRTHLVAARDAIQDDMAREARQALRAAQRELRRSNGTAGRSAEETASNFVVQPQSPQIRVDMPEPDVRVQQRQPQVSVNQQQPQISVHQPAPRVTVDIPQPEITVRMPQPDVAVNQRKPQVEVEQGQPQVSVARQGDATVRASQQPDDDRAQVDVQSSGQADVTVRNADRQPQVRYQRDEAEVTVNQPQGEPQVRYETSGDRQAADNQPTSQDRQAAAGQSRDRQSQDGQNNRRVAARMNSDASQPANGRAANAADDSGNRAVSANAGQQIQRTVGQLLDYDIVGENGNTLGDVEEIVRVDNRLYAVIASGGFLGLGEKEVAIPLSSLVVDGTTFRAPDISEAQMDALNEYDEDRYREVGDDQRVTLGAV